jgi:hypothetical protein
MRWSKWRGIRCTLAADFLKVKHPVKFVGGLFLVHSNRDGKRSYIKDGG